MDQRIGNAERDLTVSILADHLRAGRLTSTEYEERAGRARAAVTWADVDPLFADLPAPHPTRPAPPAAPYGRRGGPHQRTVGQRAVVTDLNTGDTLHKLRKFIPVIVFFLIIVTHQWWWFWLIPVVFIAGGKGRRRRN